MAKRVKHQIVKLPDYGDEEINRLAVAQHALGSMDGVERSRALAWFKQKYSAEWPSDNI